MGKSLKKVIMVAVVAAIAISATVFFYDLNGKSFDFSKSELMVVPTGSMDGSPTDYEISTIPVDSLIMSHKLSAEEKTGLKIGDVITFHQDGIIKVHRVVMVFPDGSVITKGDANILPDAPVPSGDIVGKVVGVSPTVGKAVSAVKGAMDSNPVVFAIGVILLIVMIFAIGELISLLRQRPDQKQ